MKSYTVVLFLVSVLYNDDVYLIYCEVVSSVQTLSEYYDDIIVKVVKCGCIYIVGSIGLVYLLNVDETFIFHFLHLYTSK